MRNTLFTLLFLFPFGLSAQYYYPPLSGNQWDTVSIQSMGWCQDKVDSLVDFVEAHRSKSFMILHKGKIVLEEYFGTFTQDSLWYWASAGKTLTAFLVGCAQEDGYLDLDDSTSAYLGTGWTSCTPAQEEQITVRNQLKMTTGLNDNNVDLNCLDDTCLTYLADPDTRWAYYNAPYRLLLDVLVNATGASNINILTYQRIGSRIGMGGLWVNYVRYGKLRDLARFGLLNLSKGVWDGDSVMTDTTYFREMTTQSQSLNPSYGYLWWLNGQGSYQLPRIQFLFQGDLIPSAPDDMISALGKNDQKIYVVPSMDLVVVRQGDAADTLTLALSSFDDNLWARIMDLECVTSTPERKAEGSVSVFPNPAQDQIQVVLDAPIQQGDQLELYDMGGRLLLQRELDADAGQTQIRVDLSALPEGLHFLRLSQGSQTYSRKVWVQRP